MPVKVLSGPVQIPRAKAIAIAEFERDSLALRANTSQSCAHLWTAAARQAGSVVQHLRMGHDDIAAAEAAKVGPAWKRAADCEGWPTPQLASSSRGGQLSGLGALGVSGSERLINLLDSIPLVERSRAVSIVRDFETTVADAAEKRVRAKIVPQVESAVKKGILVSLGLSAAIGAIAIVKSRR